MKGAIKNIEECKVIVCEPPFTFNINHPERQKKLAHANKIGLGKVVKETSNEKIAHTANSK